MTSKGPLMGQGSSRFNCLNVMSDLSSADAALKPGRPAAGGNHFLMRSAGTPLKRSAAYTPSDAVATTLESMSVASSLTSQLASLPIASRRMTAREYGSSPVEQPADHRRS